MSSGHLDLPIGRTVSLPGHFEVPVILEDARPLGPEGTAGYECRVRLPDGTLDEAVISAEEARDLSGGERSEAAGTRPVDADREYVQLDLDFGGDDPRGRKTFLLATREHERIDDHFVNLPLPLYAGEFTHVFCAHTPEGNVAAVGLSGKEPAELRAKLKRKFGG